MGGGSAEQLLDLMERVRLRSLTHLLAHLRPVICPEVVALGWRSASRGPALVWCRGILVAGMTTVIALLASDPRWLQPGRSFGAPVWESLSYLQWAVVLLIAPGLTAHALAEERRQRTLELWVLAVRRPESVIRALILGRALLILGVLLVGIPLSVLMARLDESPVAPALTSYLTAAALTLVYGCLGAWCAAWLPSDHAPVAATFLAFGSAPGLALLVWDPTLRWILLPVSVLALEATVRLTARTLLRPGKRRSPRTAPAPRPTPVKGGTARASASTALVRSLVSRPPRSPMGNALIWAGVLAVGAAGVTMGIRGVWGEAVLAEPAAWLGILGTGATGAAVMGGPVILALQVGGFVVAPSFVLMALTPLPAREALVRMEEATVGRFLLATLVGMVVMAAAYPSHAGLRWLGLGVGLVCLSILLHAFALAVVVEANNVAISLASVALLVPICFGILQLALPSMDNRPDDRYLSACLVAVGLGWWLRRYAWRRFESMWLAPLSGAPGAARVRLARNH